MGDTKKPGMDKLPGNHGQFGADVETENYETLPDLDVTGPGAAEPASQDVEGAAAEATVPRSGSGDEADTPGQHQEQGGMRS
ncbi:MAG: hypothetical protein ACRYG6_10235 [Janthinobacterium lividum]